MSHAQTIKVLEAIIGDLQYVVKNLRTENSAMREALLAAEELYLQAAPGAWKNGVTDQSGTSDEGEYLAARIYDKIREALAQAGGKA